VGDLASVREKKKKCVQGFNGKARRIEITKKT
jgi:hypothetical protein